MRTRQRSILIFIVTLLAVILGCSFALLQIAFVKAEALGHFGFLGSEYPQVIYPIMYALCGLATSVIVLRAGSLGQAMLYALLVSLLMSAISMRANITGFVVSGFVDTLFYAAMVTLVGNLLIFTIVSFLSWKVRGSVTQVYR